MWLDWPPCLAWHPTEKSKKVPQVQSVFCFLSLIYTGPHPKVGSTVSKLTDNQEYIFPKRGSIVHALAFCLDCDWGEQDYNIALRKGREHNRRTGHAVTAEVGRVYEYPRRQGL